MIPKLRFSEFNDEWEEKKLEDISANGMYGMNAAAIDFDGKNKYIRITDISETSHNFVPNPLCSPNGDLDDKFLLKENDLVLARTGASTGKSYLYNKNDGKLYFAGFLIKFHINHANAKFVFYNTLRSKYENWVKIMSVRSGQPGINAEEYKTLELKLPSFPEQEKISTFLSVVDKKIVILVKKLMLWKNLKKVIMQQIFSQKIRFKNVNDRYYPDWEEKKLGDLAVFTRGPFGGSLKKSIFVDSGYKVYEQKNAIQNSLDIGEYYITKAKYNEMIRFSVAEGDLLISCSGTIGKIVIIPEKYQKGIINQALLKITTHPKVSNYYLKELLMNSEMTRHIFGGRGAAIKNVISVKELKEIEILFPSFPEQEKIANFFTAIDNKIDQLHQELEINREFKKGLLQHMFVN